jgi:hypothetical protein
MLPDPHSNCNIRAWRVLVYIAGPTESGIILKKTLLPPLFLLLGQQF